MKTYDEFVDAFKPELNQILLKKEFPPHYSETDIAPFGGCMYETYGEEVQYVVKQNIRKIWTIVTGVDESMYLLNGFWQFDRMGYLITENEWSEGDDFNILID